MSSKDAKYLSVDLESAAMEVERLMKQKLPFKASKIYLDGFKWSFKAQGQRFNDYNTPTWDRPKKRSRRGPRANYPTLVQSGNLRDSFQVILSGGMVKIINSATSDDKYNYNYAKIHNEGGGNIPQRKFMGASEKLNYLVFTMMMDDIIDTVNKKTKG